MDENFRFSSLIKKTLAIISSSLATITNTVHGEGPNNLDFQGDGNNIPHFQKRMLTSKLVLKLNSNNLLDGKVVMHTSHSSHSSHSSHASHASHYSSSPSYTPTTTTVLPNTTPIYKPSKPILGNKETTDSYHLNRGLSSSEGTKNSNKLLHYYRLGSRTLFKGCRGTDVKQLQELLIKLGYDIIANGYFDETTKVAVMDFQTTNYLTADGKVGQQTLLMIQQ